MKNLPAILGGEKLFPNGPYSGVPDNPLIFENLRKAFHDCTWSGYDTGHVNTLEKTLTSLFEVETALTCASGTLAVEVALKSLRLPEGSLVGMAAYDYPGNFLAIHALGLMPFLIDTDPDNAQVSLTGIREALGHGISALVVSHLHGGLVPMHEVMALCENAGVPVIEDACQAPLAVVQGKPAGSWGDFGALSFGGSKLITSGRGGAILSRKPDLAQRAKMHLLRGSKIAALSELQALVLLPQFMDLKKNNQSRQLSARLLEKGLSKIPGVKSLLVSEAELRAFYKLGLIYDSSTFGLDRKSFIAAMQAEGIACDAGFDGIHRHRSPSRWKAAGPLPNADILHDCMLVVHHPVLLQGEEAIFKIIQAMDRIQKHGVEVWKALN
jgi:perosamine synthetase